MDHTKESMESLFQTEHFDQTLKTFSIELLNSEHDPTLREHVYHQQQILNEGDNLNRVLIFFSFCFFFFKRYYIYI